MEYSTQIAIIGAGASGMSAAAAAAELGAGVIVLEANAAVGGNGLFPRGIFGINSRIQRSRLIFADSDAIFKAGMDYSHWKLDTRIMRALIDKSGNTIDWLEGKGVVFSDVVHHTPNQTPEVFHICPPPIGVGKAVISALKLFCENSGVRILTNTRAKTILFSDDGAISGVLAEAKDGKTVKINSSKVIICSGGFAGNNEMIQRFYPGFDSSLISTTAGMQHMGDGLTMAIEAGADVEGNFTMEMAAPKIRGYDALNLLVGKPQNVWVNAFGMRFADEGIVYDFTRSANACLRQPNAKVWVLFDSAQMEAALADGRDPVELVHLPPDAESKLDVTIEKAQKDGALKISDTIDGLADFIGCTISSLTDTIDEYNRFCKNNRDALFAKDIRYLNPIEYAPFYAVAAGVDMLITHGGARVNERFEALDKNRQVIKGLYVAGVDFGGADADVYNMTMSGHGFGFAVNSGRIAGENAVI